MFLEKFNKLTPWQKHRWRKDISIFADKPAVYNGQVPNDNIVKSAYLYKKIEERKLKKYLELKKCLMGVYDENNITSEEKNKYKKKIEGKYTTAQREIKKLEGQTFGFETKRRG